MCGSIDSNAVIKSNTTAAQDAAQRKATGIAGDGTAKTQTANEYTSKGLMMQGFSIAPPPNGPDFTDLLVRNARAGQAARLSTGSRRNSFLGGGYLPSVLGGG